MRLIYHVLNLLEFLVQLGMRSNSMSLLSSYIEHELILVDFDFDYHIF